MAKGKEPTMKLSSLIWVLGLAGVIAACNTGAPITGCKPGEIVNLDGRCKKIDTGTGGTGGAGGAGGGGGSVGGECTNDADEAVYDALTYTNDDGESSTGSDAASAIASDCVFGGDDTVPPEGCGELAAIVIVCASSMTCTPKMIQDLTKCVGECAQDTIESITGSRLSDGCGACYSESVACSAARCATSGCSTPTSTECVQCRCEEGCTPGFDACSGLEPSGVCDEFLP
jgi:hypothetical protein